MRSMRDLFIQKIRIYRKSRNEISRIIEHLTPSIDPALLHISEEYLQDSFNIHEEYKRNITLAIQSSMRQQMEDIDTAITILKTNASSLHAHKKAWILAIRKMADYQPSSTKTTSPVTRIQIPSSSILPLPDHKSSSRAPAKNSHKTKHSPSSHNKIDNGTQTQVTPAPTYPQKHLPSRTPGPQGSRHPIPPIRSTTPLLGSNARRPPRQSKARPPIRPLMSIPVRPINLRTPLAMELQGLKPTPDPVYISSYKIQTKYTNRVIPSVQPTSFEHIATHTLPTIAKQQPVILFLDHPQQISNSNWEETAQQIMDQLNAHLSSTPHTIFVPTIRNPNQTLSLPTLYLNIKVQKLIQKCNDPRLKFIHVPTDMPSHSVDLFIQKATNNHLNY